MNLNPTPWRPRFSVVGVVMAAVAIWCGLIAVGVFNQSGGSWIKSAIVIGVAIVFLGGWWMALKRR